LIRFDANRREKVDLSLTEEFAVKIKRVREPRQPVQCFLAEMKSRAMTRSISAASQPTEDENGGGRRNRTKELQEAYLATCTKKVKEEEEALRSFRPRV